MKRNQETQQDLTVCTYLGQDRRDRAAGEANVSSTSTKRRIDMAGRTRGLDQTNHRPPSSRHLMSPLPIHLSYPVLPLFLCPPSFKDPLHLVVVSLL